jgi:hypothetical protein
VLDGFERGVGPCDVVVQHPPRAGRLHGDDRHTMGGDVVQLPGDACALGRDGQPQPLLAFVFQLARPCFEGGGPIARHLGAVAQPPPDSDDDDVERHHVHRAGEQQHAGRTRQDDRGRLQRLAQWPQRRFGVQRDDQRPPRLAADGTIPRRRPTSASS